MCFSLWLFIISSSTMMILVTVIAVLRLTQEQEGFPGRFPGKQWKDTRLTTVIAVLRLTQEWEGFLERFPKNGRVGRLPGKVL